MAIRKLVHIECGDENWTPTEDELVDICSHFYLATRREEGGVVATHLSEPDSSQ
jgi:hypothetical protein